MLKKWSIPTLQSIDIQQTYNGGGSDMSEEQAYAEYGRAEWLLQEGGGGFSGNFLENGFPDS